MSSANRPVATSAHELWATSGSPAALLLRSRRRSVSMPWPASACANALLAPNSVALCWQALLPAAHSASLPGTRLLPQLRAAGALLLPLTSLLLLPLTPLLVLLLALLSMLPAGVALCAGSATSRLSAPARTSSETMALLLALRGRMVPPCLETHNRLVVS